MKEVEIPLVDAVVTTHYKRGFKIERKVLILPCGYEIKGRNQIEAPDESDALSEGPGD